MPKNIIDKIWEAHVVHKEEGMPGLLFIDLQLLHEVTSPQAFTQMRERGASMFAPDRQIATLDHSIPTDTNRSNFVDERNRKQLEALRKNTKDFGIKLLDVGSGHQGVVHVTGPELGLTQPGMTIVCGDSHTSTHGAFGVLAFGIGTSQIAHVMETSCILMRKPKTMRVHFQGSPDAFFTAKDAILLLIQTIGVKGGVGYVMEYTGTYIEELDMEERMTMCNMSIECGARAGLIAPDKKTVEYLQRTKYGNRPELVEHWMSLRSDAGASYDEEITIDLQGKAPVVTWGTTPAQSICLDERIPKLEEMPAGDRSLAERSLTYTDLEAGQELLGVPVDYVFLGSCTNGRLSDLRAAAKIIEGKQVSDEVQMLVVPGSEEVEAKAEAEGLLDIFRAAGADVRRPGCSMCLAMNGDMVPAGKRCISTSNRNFVGRQGPGAITHLASPVVAAASAITGVVTHPKDLS